MLSKMSRSTDFRAFSTWVTIIAVIFVSALSFPAAVFGNETPPPFWFEWGSPGGSDNGTLGNLLGVGVDSSGNVYVADSGNSRIQIFDSSGGYIDKWVDKATVPADVAFDSSGNVYVVDVAMSCIRKFDSSGAAESTGFLPPWSSYGTGPGQFITPISIAIDSSGNVYVVDSGTHRVQKFDGSGGLLIPPWGTYGTGPNQFISPFGIAINSSDNVVYVADKGNHRIQIFNSSGDNISAPWGIYGTGDGEFDSPRGVAVDSSGNVYVADYGNNRIQKFNSSGGYICKWGNYGTGPGQFKGPADIAIDSSDNVYVADDGNNRIQKFNSSGGYLTQWGSLHIGNGQFLAPADVAIDSSGNVYVVDSGTHRVQKFNGSGGLLIPPWGTYGTGDGQFNTPTGVAVDSSGNVYVTDSLNSRIQKFNGSGGLIRKWGAPGTAPDQFLLPQDIAIDSSGNVYVADLLNHRVQKFDGSGGYITQWGAYGTGDGQLAFPRGIAVDPSGNIYVADGKNIQKFDSSGGLLIPPWGTYGTGDGQLAWPFYVHIDSAGNVYVADAGNNRIQKFDSSGGYITQWGSYGTGPGQFDKPRGIAVDSSGNVYVADTGNHRIQVFGYPVTTGQLASATGTGLITVNISNGNIQNLTTLGQSQLTCPPKEDVGFPHGFLALNITGVAPGSCVTVTITLPSAVPVGTQYWKCQNGAWVQIPMGSDDGDNVITITLCDGGLGDADGVVNAVIVDPGGPATLAPAQAGAQRASPTLQHQLRPAQISLHYLSVTPQQTSAGQPVTITTNVVNTGDEGGNYNIALKINGQVEETRMVSVGPQGTQPVKFTITKAKPGTYAIDIGGQKGSFTVVGAAGKGNGTTNSSPIVAIVTCIAVLLVGGLILVIRNRFRAN